MTQNDYFICKAEEWGAAAAASIDDNEADEKSGKSMCQLIHIRCNRFRILYMIFILCLRRR